MQYKSIVEYIILYLLSACVLYKVIKDIVAWRYRKDFCEYIDTADNKKSNSSIGCLGLLGSIFVIGISKRIVMYIIEYIIIFWNLLWELMYR